MRLPQGGDPPQQTFTLPAPYDDEGDDIPLLPDFDDCPQPLQSFHAYSLTRERFPPNAEYPQGGLNVTYTHLPFKILKELKQAI